MKIRLDRVDIFFDSFNFVKKDYGYGEVDVIQLIIKDMVIAELREEHELFIKREELK